MLATLAISTARASTELEPPQDDVGTGSNEPGFWDRYGPAIALVAIVVCAGFGVVVWRTRARKP